MALCSDPSPALMKLECFRSTVCPEGLSDDDFPWLTSTDERGPTFFERIAFWAWIWQAVAVAAITALLAWLQREDLIPDPFDITAISYVGGIALSASFLGVFGALAAFAYEQVVQFRNMGNAVTSFAGNLAGAFTREKAIELTKTTFNYTYYPYQCNGQIRFVKVNGEETLCFLAMILQSAVYSVTRFLSKGGVDIDRLPLKFSALRNEVYYNTSKRNRNHPSVLMRMAQRIVTEYHAAGLLSDDGYGHVVGAVNDFNTAIGALAVAKEVRVTRYSNWWLRVIVFVTTPFIPLALDFSLEVKIIFSFLLAMVLYSTLAISVGQSNVTDLDNPIAGARLKDEDDPIAAAAVAEIASIITHSLGIEEASVAEAFAPNVKVLPAPRPSSYQYMA